MIIGRRKTEGRKRKKMEEMMDRKETEEEINALLRTQYVDRKFQ